MFSHLRTFSLSLSLLNRLSEWKLPRLSLVQFLQTIESEKPKQSCHCMFLHTEQAVLLFNIRVFFILCLNKSPKLFKCNEESTTLLTDVTKYRVCFWDLKSEHSEKKKGLWKCNSENCAGKEISRNHYRESKIGKNNPSSNSAKLLKSKRSCASIENIYVLHLFWLKQTL